MPLNIGEILATTIESRSGKLADNVSDGNIILKRLKEKGSWRPANGRVIYEELDFIENQTFQWYSGGETLNVSQSQVLTAAEYNWKQASTAVVITGLESVVQNAGREQIIDLLDGRVTNAERTMKNKVTAGMYSDGTGSLGKQLGGLQLLVADSPSTGVVGGIDRAAYPQWQNKKFSGVGDGSGAVSATNIQTYMNNLFLQCTRGTDRPDLITADSNYFAFFMNSLQQIQRVYDPKMAQLGFQSLKFVTADVVYEDNPAHPSNHMYFLNTDYLFLRYAPQRLFKPLAKVRSVNQDADVQLITFAGNLTASNLALQGVLIA